MAQQKKRTAGDDLRDFKAGKISGNYYHNGIDRSDNYVQHTSAPYRMTNDKGKTQIVSYNDWLQQEVFKGKHALPNGTTNNSTSSNSSKNSVTNANTKKNTKNEKTPLQNNFDMVDSSAKDFKKSIEDPNKSGIKNKKSENNFFDFQKAESEFEATVKNPNQSLETKVKELSSDYDTAVKNNDTTTANIIKNEYKNLADRVNKQTKINQQNAETAAAENKKLAEQEQKEQQYSDKYKNSTLEQRQNARIHATAEELNWLNKHMYDNATSEELENYNKQLDKEAESLWNKRDEEQAYNRLKTIEDEQGKLKTAIDNAKLNERKKSEYNDVVDNDIKAKTVLQKYYALQDYNDTKHMLASTGHGIESITNQVTLDDYNYINKLSDKERTQIENDFKNLKKEGYDTDSLYKWYERERDAEKATETTKISQEFADNHPVLGSIASVGARLGGAVPDALKYISTDFDKKYNGGDGYINPEETNTAISDSIRSKVSENINNDFGSFLYNTGMSMADFTSLLPLNAIPGGQALSLGIMGTSAGVGAANEVIENGGTIDNAVKTGFAAGIAETLFEKVSLEQLSVFKASGKSTMRAAIGDILKGAFTEGSEEAFTDLANRLTDDAINGDLSSYNRSKQKYIEQGMSEADAEKAASWEFWQNVVALDFAGGAMSGGALNLITAGVNLGGVKLDLAKNKESNLADGKAALADENFDINLLIKQGPAAEKNDRAYNLAKKMEKAIENGGKEKIEAADVGNLRFLIGREISRNPELINRIAEVTKAETENAQSGQTVNRNTVQTTQEVPQNEQENTQPSQAKQANSVINTTKKADTESVSRQYEAYAFGKKHPNGIMATDVSTGKAVKIAIKNLESSSKVNLNDEENTLVFNTTDGKQVNADSITFSNSRLDTIVHSANEFDTYGARNYISNFEEWSESPQAQKMSNEEQLYKYNNAYSAAYNYGRKGVKFDTLKQGESSNYRILNSILGENIIKQAMSAGRRDVNIITQHHANRLTELINRNGRADTSGVTVYADNGTDVSHIPQELINTLGNLATKTGRNIIISDRLADGVNGVAKDGNIYLSSEITSHKILATALHEAGHTIKKTNPTEWQTLSNFVSDYLVRRGIDLNKMIDRTIERYGNRLTPDEGENTRDAALEEIVCDTLMSLASDEKALNIALGTKQNKSKIAAAIKSLINKVKEWLIGKSTNYGAKAFAKDIEALEQLAERFSKAADTARENITEQTEVQNGERLDVEKYSIKRNRHYAKQGGTFSNALTSEEWTKFSNAMSTGLDAGLRISDNSILVECEENSKYQYKLVIYDNTFEDNPLEKVYAIGNIDYNKINVKDIADFIIKLEDKEYDSRKVFSQLLRNCTKKFGCLLGRYNIKSRGFNDIGRKSVENGRIDEGQSNRAGVNQEIGRELSSGVKEKFSLDEDYDFSDPSKLDEEELKIYNNRGWSYGLFNKEDMALLSEKVLELKKGTQKADNALWDGSRLVEVNNKLIILGGTFKNPEIYSILVINANNETDAEFIKGDFYYDFNRCKRFREVVTNLCKSIEIVQGEEFVRFYDSIDYTYKRGRGRNWVPATLPSNFEDYGYSKGRNERYGSSFRTGKSVSAVQLNEETDNSTDEKTGVIHDTLKFSIDDEYNDLFDFDYADDKHIDFEKAVDESNPELTIEQIYHHSARNVKEGLLAGKGIKPETKKIYNMVKSLMRNYHINTNAETESLVTDYVDALNTFINSVQNDKSSFTDAFESFVMQCRESLTYSTQLDEQHEAWAKEIRKELYGTTLLIPDSAVDTIKENYGSVGKYRKSLFGKINVKLERNARGITGSANGSYIEDIGSHLEEIGGRSLMIEDGFDWDSDSGYRILDRIINYVLAPQYVSTYDGQIQSESTIDAAAIQMAFDTTAEYLKEQGRAAVQQNNIDKKKLRDLNKTLKQAQKAKNALHKKTVENYKAAVAEQKAKYNEQREKYRKAYNALKDKNTEQAKKYRTKIQELKELSENQKAVIEADKDTLMDRYTEKKEQTKYRQMLGRKFDKLVKKFDAKSKNTENIPEALKGPILDVLKGFKESADPGQYKNGGKKYIPKYFGAWNNVVEIGERVRNLYEEYKSLEPKSGNKDNTASKGMQYSYIDINSIAYNERTLKMLEILKDEFAEYAVDENGETMYDADGNPIKAGYKNIFDLSSSDLRLLYDTMNALETSLSQATEIIIDGQRESIASAAEKALDEISKANYNKGVNINVLSKNAIGNKINAALSDAKELNNKFIATHLDPVRYGRFLSGYNDKSIVAKIFRELRDGDVKRENIMQKAYTKLQSVAYQYSKKELAKIQKGDVKEFDFRDIKTGERVKVSQGVIMSIYLTDQQSAGRKHLCPFKTNYYTVLPDLDSANSIKHSKREKSKSENSHKVRFTGNDLQHIKEYVEGNKMLREISGTISEVLNNELQQEINEVSMSKYGMLIATVKNYFPITVYGDGAAYEKDFSAEFNDLRMKSRGFVKRRETSYAPIVIDDVFRVFNRHANSVAEWCGLTTPIENFKKVYNWINTNNPNNSTLHEAIMDKYGKSAEHYIDKLMGDLQKSKDTIDNNLLTRMQGNYMGAVLLLNPGAMIKQFAAFPTANSYFGTKNVAIASAGGMWRVNLDKYAEYTPYLWYRAEGNGTVVGELSREAGIVGGTKAKIDIMGKVDRYVVGCLLKAAELHVEQTTDLKKGSDAFYKEVEKCVDETQPNNMITTKPQFIRNNYLKILSTNAFRSQTMAIGNTILDSYMEYSARSADYKSNKTAENKTAKRTAMKKFAKSLIGATESALLIGGLTTLVNMFLWHKWDDDRDDEGNITAENIIKSILDYGMESFAGSFVFGDTAYSAIAHMIDNDRQFYGLDSMSLENINNIITDISKGDVVSAATLLGDCFELPASNLKRISLSLTSYFTDLTKGRGEIISDNKGNINTTVLVPFMINATIDGDTEKAKYYEQLYINTIMNTKGKTEMEARDMLEQKVITALSKNNNDIEKAAVERANGNLDEYEDLINKVSSYGFEKNDIIKASDKVINNIIANMKKAGITDEDEVKSDLIDNQGFTEQGAVYIWNKMSSSTDSEESEKSIFDSTENEDTPMYKYSDAFEYLKNGDTESYQKVEKYLMENKDKSKTQIKTLMQSASRTDPIFKQYIEASKSNDADTTHTLYKQLLNIYGSESKFKSALKKYQDKVKKQKSE